MMSDDHNYAFQQAFAGSVHDNNFMDGGYLPTSLKGRRAARCFALQALYQYEITKKTSNQIIAQFSADNSFKKVDIDYFKQLVNGTISQYQQLDAIFMPFLDRDFAQITPIECAILRLASWELTHCLEIPYKVIINEAVELAKLFGAAEAHKYINGILDKLATKLRTHG